MRVCHIITKPELGGAQISTLNIVSCLSKDKYEISVITSPNGILKPEFTNIEKIKSFLSPFLIRTINPLYDILAFIHIYLIYRRKRFTILHTHSSKAGIVGRWAARLARIPVIVHSVHGWSFNDYQLLVLKRFCIFLEKITARFTTRIICVSKKDIEIGLKHKIACKEKFVLIRYGIPLLKFRKMQPPSFPLQLGEGESVKRRLGIANNDPLVGMIACLKPQKAPIDYIKACIKIYEKLPNVNFLLVGDGVLRAKCERLIAASSLNGRFIFAGWRRDIAEILDILDVVVLTSKWEGMPISIIEALCKGCPVVAADAGGVSELVKDGITGHLTRIGAYEEVAERVLEILKDKKSFNRMKKEASLSIDDSFSSDKMVSDIDDLYQSLR